MAEQLKARAEVLVEDRDLAIEHERRYRQGGDRGGELAEPAGVVDAVAAQQMDAGAILVREDSPASTFSS